MSPEEANQTGNNPLRVRVLEEVLDDPSSLGKTLVFFDIVMASNAQPSHWCRRQKEVDFEVNLSLEDRWGVALRGYLTRAGGDVRGALARISWSKGRADEPYF